MLSHMCLAFALICGLAPPADAFFRRYRCPDRCNPHPERPVSRCFFFCASFIPYGQYHDGTECYHLSPLGNFFDWRGYCYHGFCTRWRSQPSAAEIRCSNGTTSTSTTTRTTTGRDSSTVTIPESSSSPVTSSTVISASDAGNETDNIDSTSPQPTDVTDAVPQSDDGSKNHVQNDTATPATSTAQPTSVADKENATSQDESAAATVANENATGEISS
uniref:Basic tail secreted protein n=1 Tax=Rhipicephalus appendiculatus TaxID=34631 RepID=A0A131YMT4_RHIAP